MFYEIEAFTDQTTRAFEGADLVIGDAKFIVRRAIYVPLGPGEWARIRRYAETRGEGVAPISDYWQTRRQEFVYIYARRQRILAIAGYFASGYVGQFIVGEAQNMGKPPVLDIHRTLFERFRVEMGPTIRAWYPLLPSLVDHYDLFKNHHAASTLTKLAQGDAVDPDGSAVLEIGAGGCLLPMFLHRMMKLRSYDVVDLDFVIPFGFAMLRSFAPELPIALPGEDTDGTIVRFHDSKALDFTDDVHDMAVNITSFGEMSPVIVADYFALLARTLRPGGLFACINRQAKVTRFEDYPWGLIAGEVLVDEVDPTSGYHDPDPIRRRIIRKS